MMTNPMQMMQQLQQFKSQIQGDPKKMVEQLISSGQISQQQLNQFQNQANQIMAMMRKMNIRF